MAGGSRPKESEKEPEWYENLAVKGAVLLVVCTLAGGIIFGLFSQFSQTRKVVGPSVKSGQEQVFAQWYARAAEASKKATRLAQRGQQIYGGMIAGKPGSGPTLVAPSVVERIRGMSQVLDTCQEDIYNEFWIGLDTYPGVLRGLLPLLSYYTDSAFPAGNPGTAVEQIRFALKYEVGRISRGVVDLEKGVQERSIYDVERAFAEMALGYDRYLKAGNLYAGYDPVTSTSIFYENIDEKQLVYTPLSLQQARIRDEVLVIRGPDKGKVGKVIWLGKNGLEKGTQDPGAVATATVQLDANPLLAGDRSTWQVREVKTYPFTWIAVTRTTEQSYLLDLVLGGLAALFSCALTYPLDSLKSRIQSGLPLLPPSGIPGLFNGLTFNLCREVPNQALYMAGFNFLTRQFCLLPFVDANNPGLKLLVMVPAGIGGFMSGSFIRAPFEILNKQMQTGQASSEEEAIQNVFFKPTPAQVRQSLQKSWILCVIKGVPFGALQCTFYEFFKDQLELVRYGVPVAAEPFVWGALAGILTGVITNPPDVVLSRVNSPGPAAGEGGPASSSSSSFGRSDGTAAPAEAEEDTWRDLWEATAAIAREDGLLGFFRGAEARALYFAPEACLWFAAYEILRDVSETIAEV